MEHSYFWTEDEHLAFIVLLQKHGRKWKSISNEMQGRGTLQCRTHGQKYIIALTKLKEEV